MPEIAEQPTTQPPSKPSVDTTTAVVPPDAEPGKRGGAVSEIRESIRSDNPFWDRILPKISGAKSDKKEAKADSEKPKSDQPQPTKPDDTQAAAAAAAAPTPTAQEPASQPAKRRRKGKDLEEPAVEQDKTDRMIDAVASAAAMSAAEAVRQTAATPQDKVTRAPVVDDLDLTKELPEEYVADGDILLEMQRAQPAKYQGLVRQLVDFKAKETAYVRKWEKSHPGESFDPESSEHDDFYVDEPKFEQKDFRQAERAILKREAASEVHRELGPEIEQFKASRKDQEIRPIIQRQSLNAITDILDAINPEFGKIAAEPEKLAEIDAKDPIAGAVASSISERTLPLVQETIRLHSQAVRFDPNNAIHMQLYNEARAAENEIMALPIRDRMDDDRRVFATREAYAAMTPAERSKHWILGQEELVSILVSRARKQAAEMYKAETKRFESYAKQRGYKASDEISPSPSTQTPPSPNDANAPATARLASPPATAAPSVTAHTVIGDGAAKPAPSQKTGFDMFYDRLFSQ